MGGMSPLADSCNLGANQEGGVVLCALYENSAGTAARPAAAFQ